MVVGLINSGDTGTIISLDLNTLLLLIQRRHRVFYPYVTELALIDCALLSWGSAISYPCKFLFKIPSKL